ncbi:hypothetical protein ACHMW5_11185 [Azospirillum melinis]|uniref:hypothetical protein n=1 Tax=Azospirillum melinis TaxID=328839 RepID=UPI00375757AC
MTERWLDQRRMELLEHLASGAQAISNENGILIFKNGVRQQTQHSARDLAFLMEIGFAQSLAADEPKSLVKATNYGEQYVAESYWINGRRIGRLRDGRVVIGMPDQFVDVPSITPGFIGHKEAGRLLMLALQRYRTADA